MFIKTQGTEAKDRGLAMIILGCISINFTSNNLNSSHLTDSAPNSAVFIPGSYASTVLFGAWRGWPGYEYSMIPSYDD